MAEPCFRVYLWYTIDLNDSICAKYETIRVSINDSYQREFMLSYHCLYSKKNISLLSLQQKKEVLTDVSGEKHPCKPWGNAVLSQTVHTGPSFNSLSRSNILMIIQNYMREKTILNMYTLVMALTSKNSGPVQHHIQVLTSKPLPLSQSILALAPLKVLLRNALIPTNIHQLLHLRPSFED